MCGRHGGEFDRRAAFGASPHHDEKSFIRGLTYLLSSSRAAGSNHLCHKSLGRQLHGDQA